MQTDQIWQGLAKIRQLWRSPATRWGVGLVLFLCCVAMIAPIIIPYDPAQDRNLELRLRSPSLAHPLGTDGLGRELWILAWYGLRLSLGISLASVALGACIGLVLGLMAGYLRGYWDMVLGWLTDILLAFPPILLAIAVVTIFGSGLWGVAIAVGVIQIPIFLRLVRAQVLSLSSQDFILAAEGMGASPFHVLWVHLLPACLGFFTVQAALSTGTATLEAAGLGFLGLGAQPPTPELGTMLADGFRNGYALSAPWTMVVPGIVITLMVFAFNVLGDGLRDEFDPRS
jgi:peptide/nickel transport system permease protein